MQNRQRSKRWLGLGLAALVIGGSMTAPVRAQTPTAAIDPEAMAILKRATDFISGLQSFSFSALTTIEMVTDDGQKLQIDHDFVVDVKRPNMMRVVRVGEIINQDFYYDGKALTLNLPEYNYYAIEAVPPTIDAMIPYARDKLKVFAPAGDLLETDAYARLSDGLTAARIVGDTVIGGVPCDHVAFRNPEVDWQIWVRQGPVPTVCKFAITSKKFAQSPNFVATMTKWDTAAKFDDATFSFKPTAKSVKVPFITPIAAATN